jgi:hypothetical protein
LEGLWVNNTPGEGERVPLVVRDFGAVDEDVLPSAGGRLLFLDLDLHDVGRVLYNFGNVGNVARAHFTEDTLVDPDNATNKPVTLQCPSQDLNG